MKRIKALGLALAAVFALSAVAVAAAQAEPEFVPKKGVFPVKFSSSSLTNKTKLETVGGHKVECEGLNSKGELESKTKATNVVVHFTKCTSSFGAKCEGGTGHKAEEIVTEPLVATPHYINKHITAKVGERGLVVEPKTTNGKFAEFLCGGVVTTVVQGETGKDAVIGVIAEAEVGKQEKQATIKFVETAGVQAQTTYEAPAGTLHEKIFLDSEGKGIGGFPKEQSAESATETIAYEGGEEVELT